MGEKSKLFFSFSSLYHVMGLLKIKMDSLVSNNPQSAHAPRGLYFACKNLLYSFYCAASVFIAVFISAVFSAALSCVTSPATSALPMFSAGDQ